MILAKIIGGNIWECQICKEPDPRRLREVTSMMIHLVQVHPINLELQSFPPGILQTGALFHVTTERETDDEKFKKLFSQPSPYSNR
jgi:hypothetical protein